MSHKWVFRIKDQRSRLTSLNWQTAMRQVNKTRLHLSSPVQVIYSWLLCPGGPLAGSLHGTAGRRAYSCLGSVSSDSAFRLVEFRQTEDNQSQVLYLQDWP